MFKLLLQLKQLRLELGGTRADGSALPPNALPCSLRRGGKARAHFVDSLHKRHKIRVERVLPAADEGS
jgi:hypothetical protein